MAAGDRQQNPSYGGYALYETLDEAIANGFKKAGLNVVVHGATDGSALSVDNKFTAIGSNTANGSLAAAVPLTPPTGATKLLVQAFTQNVRFTMDGATVPTAAVGFQLKAGDPAVMIPVVFGTVVKVIEESASAAINYQWGS
jgi:hypothetical protein